MSATTKESVFTLEITKATNDSVVMVQPNFLIELLGVPAVTVLPTHRVGQRIKCKTHDEYKDVLRSVRAAGGEGHCVGLPPRPHNVAVHS